jgi:hypothetical protein
MEPLRGDSKPDYFTIDRDIRKEKKPMKSY